jgi:hypothetical protein
MQSASTQLDLSSLGNTVRKWVYYDSTVSALNKQAAQARQARDLCETEIIGTLRRNNYQNAILQIAGGRLSIAEEKHSQPLTFKSLEEHLHAYFQQKTPMVKDETGDILKFIKENRSMEVTQRLKKQMDPGSKV